MSLRVGIVGCGKIADSHVEQVRAVGGAEVVAVCDRELMMAEQLSLRFAIPAFYGDLDRMLATERIDVLHVATPPDSHEYIAVRAMDAGCHVFLEKPIALTRAQVEGIIAVASRTNRKVSVNYLYLYESPSLRLNSLMADGSLGELVHADSLYGYNLSGDYGLAVLSDSSHWVHRLPGKLFHNVLDHVLCKYARLVSCAPVDVQATSFRRRAGTGDAVVDALPDELRVQMRAGAATLFITVSAHAKPTAHTMRVLGTRDSCELDFVGRTFVRSARQTQQGSVGRLLPAWSQSGQFAREGWRNLRDFMSYRYHFFQGMRDLLRDFYSSIRADGPLPVSYDEMLWTSGVIDQIVASTGQSVAPTTMLGER